MSLYDELRKHRSTPAEQKLKILQEEVLRPILTVETSAELLQEVIPDISAEAASEARTVRWRMGSR